jgi:hypothetical protein
VAVLRFVNLLIILRQYLTTQASAEFQCATNILAYYLNRARNKTHNEFNLVKIAARLPTEGTAANINKAISRTLPALA